MLTIDTTNMCSHLQRKLFEEDGISLWIAMQNDPELTAVVRSRQLHIYRNGKKVLVLAGRSAPKIIREDAICEILQIERIKWMEQRFNNAMAAIKDGSADSLKAIKEDVAELSKYYGSELWKLDFAADETGNLPPDLKRGVLSEDGIWNLLSDYREYCLSLGADVEEKLPFQKFKSGEGVLVFYVMGHMFSFFDCNDFSVISLKCQPERIEDLKAQHDCIGNPYNESPKHWIGINPNSAPDDLLQELTRNSYEIVKAKYASKRGQKQTRLDFAEREHTRPKVKYTKK